MYIPPTFKQLLDRGHTNIHTQREYQNSGDIHTHTHTHTDTQRVPKAWTHKLTHKKYQTVHIYLHVHQYTCICMCMYTHSLRILKITYTHKEYQNHLCTCAEHQYRANCYNNYLFHGGSLSRFRSKTDSGYIEQTPPHTSRPSCPLVTMTQDL